MSGLHGFTFIYFRRPVIENGFTCFFIVSVRLERPLPGYGSKMVYMFPQFWAHMFPNYKEINMQEVQHIQQAALRTAQSQGI